MRSLRAVLVTTAAVLMSLAAVGTQSASGAANGQRSEIVAATVVPSLYRAVAWSTSTTIGLEFNVAPRNPAALASFISGVSTPGSAQYGRYLAKGNYASRFGATDATISTITHYLTAHGLSSVSASPDHLFVRARGSIRAVDALLHTSIREYIYKGTHVYANVTPAVVPTVLSRAVRTVLGLSTVPQFLASYSIGRTVAHTSSDCSHMTKGINANSGPFTVAQLGSIYKFGAFATHGDLGQGETMAIFELTNYLPGDIAHYRDCVSTNATISGINVDGGGNVSISAEVEADLDIEIAATLAPQANLQVYQGPNSEAGAVDTYQRIAVDDTAQVVSTSWGLCERADRPAVTAESAVFAEMAAQGQTVVAAAGDSGASDCLGLHATRANPLAGAIGVDDPASQPFVTAVGGTTITDASAIGTSPASQRVWNSSDLSGSGGGVSAVWPQPSYQAGVPGASASGRSVPDVSINADPKSGYMIYSLGYGWIPVGGTSCGSPMVSSLLLLANEANAMRLGFVNPLLYHVGVHDPGVNFTDITQGNNETYDVPGYSTAVVGFDAPSGWGTPIASSFVGGDI